MHSLKFWHGRIRPTLNHRQPALQGFKSQHVGATELSKITVSLDTSPKPLSLAAMHFTRASHGFLYYDTKYVSCLADISLMMRLGPEGRTQMFAIS